jgi:serine/threonine protein kinase
MSVRRPVFTIQDVDAAFAGRFFIKTQLRAGGQGVVFRARHPDRPEELQGGQDVALKLYFDPAHEARVDREIQAMTRMRHPTLADLVDHGTAEVAGQQYRYVAWEFIDGVPVDRRLLVGALSPKLTATIGRDVATAIDYIWRHRLVHRDISPKNIMLRTGEADAVLIDLGIARHLAQDSLSSSGAVWGTLGYMAPEQMRGQQQLTCGADVFALGVVLQEVLVGRHPTGGDQAGLSRGAPPTATLVAGVPGMLTEFIDRMVARRSAFRPHPAEAAERFGRLAEEL